MLNQWSVLYVCSDHMVSTEYACVVNIKAVNIGEFGRLLAGFLPEIY